MYIRCNTCVVAQDREAVGVIENKQGAEGQKIGGQVKSLHPQPTAHHPPPTTHHPTANCTAAEFAVFRSAAAAVQNNNSRIWIYD